MDAPTLSKDDQEEIKLGRLLESMVATEAWRQYTNLLAKKSAEYMANCIRPGSSRDDDQFNKGALSCLSLMMGLPQSIIGNMKDILARSGRTSEED